MKYPYIGKLKSDNSGIVLFCSDSFGAQLNCKGSGWRKDDIGVYSADDDWDEDKFKNITTEYLANTYGEVKSKEHAEFIKLLAETNKIPCAVVSIDMNYTMFYVIDGCLFFCLKEIDVVGDYKKITIPLPPECESVDEWPKVGDEVMFTDLLQHYDAYRDNYCLKTSKVIARFNTEQGEFITVRREYCAVMTVRVDMVLKDGALVKPKTPEQELRDFISLLWDENNHDFDMFLDIVTEHVIKSRSNG